MCSGSRCDLVEGPQTRSSEAKLQLAAPTYEILSVEKELEKP